MAARPPSVRTFLEALQLGQYSQKFLTAGYNTLEKCHSLSDPALEALGVSMAGHRRRILQALAGTSSQAKAQVPALHSEEPLTYELDNSGSTAGVACAKQGSDDEADDDDDYHDYKVPPPLSRRSAPDYINMVELEMIPAPALPPKRRTYASEEEELSRFGMTPKSAAADKDTQMFFGLTPTTTLASEEIQRCETTPKSPAVTEQLHSSKAALKSATGEAIQRSRTVPSSGASNPVSQPGPSVAQTTPTLVPRRSVIKREADSSSSSSAGCNKAVGKSASGGAGLVGKVNSTSASIPGPSDKKPGPAGVVLGQSTGGPHVPELSSGKGKRYEEVVSFDPITKTTSAAATSGDTSYENEETNYSLLKKIIANPSYGLKGADNNSNSGNKNNAANQSGLIGNCSINSNPSSVVNLKQRNCAAENTDGNLYYECDLDTSRPSMGEPSMEGRIMPRSNSVTSAQPMSKSNGLTSTSAARKTSPPLPNIAVPGGATKPPAPQKCKPWSTTAQGKSSIAAGHSENYYSLNGNLKDPRAPAGRTEKDNETPLLYELDQDESTTLKTPVIHPDVFRPKCAPPVPRKPGTLERGNSLQQPTSSSTGSPGAPRPQPGNRGGGAPRPPLRRGLTEPEATDRGNSCKNPGYVDSVYVDPGEMYESGFKSGVGCEGGEYEIGFQSGVAFRGGSKQGGVHERVAQNGGVYETGFRFMEGGIERGFQNSGGAPPVTIRDESDDSGEEGNDAYLAPVSGVGGLNSSEVVQASLNKDERLYITMHAGSRRDNPSTTGSQGENGAAGFSSQLKADQDLANISQSGVLYIVVATGRSTGPDRVPKWCTLDKRTLQIMDTDKKTMHREPIAMRDILSIAKDTKEEYTFHLKRREAGKSLSLAADSLENMNHWMTKLARSMADIRDVDLSRITEVDRGGNVSLRVAASDPWSRTWMHLFSKTLHVLTRDGVFNEIDLRRSKSIRFLTMAPGSAQSVFMIRLGNNRSVYIQGETKGETGDWFNAVRNFILETDGRLSNEVHTADNVPVLVDKCINFVSYHGLDSVGIYRQSGVNSKISKLLQMLTEDVENVVISLENFNVYEVATTLKRFLRCLNEPLMTESLYASWIEASKMGVSHSKLQRYKTLLDQLPLVNYCTLKRLVIHLKKVAEAEVVNKMGVSNLAALFGPILLHVEKNAGGALQCSDESQQPVDNFGAVSEEIIVMKDILENDRMLFEVNDLEREHEQRIEKAVERIRELSSETRSQCSITDVLKDDLMISVYIGERTSDSDGQVINVKVPVTRTAHDLQKYLVEKVTVPNSEHQKWILCEVICGGQLERPIHYEESVVACVLAWSSWPQEFCQNNYLCLKDSQTYELLLHCYDPLRELRNELRFSRNAGFRKRHFELTESKLLYRKDLKSVEPTATWDLSGLTFYKGTQSERNPSTPWCITFYFTGGSPLSTGNNCFGFSLSFKSEEERSWWFSAIIHRQYPQGLFPRDGVAPTATSPANLLRMNCIDSLTLPLPPTTDRGGPSKFANLWQKIAQKVQLTNPPI